MAASWGIRNPLIRDAYEVRGVDIQVKIEVPLNENFNLEKERRIIRDFLSKTTNLNPLQKVLIRKAALIEPDELNSKKSVGYEFEVDSGKFGIGGQITTLAHEFVSEARKICKVMRVTLCFQRPDTSMPENPRRVIIDLAKTLELPSISKALVVSICSYAGETLATKGPLTVTDGGILTNVDIIDIVAIKYKYPTPKSLVEGVIDLSATPLQMVTDVFYGVRWLVTGEKRWMVYSNNNTSKEQQNEELNAALQTIESSLQKQEEICQTAQELKTLINQQSEQDRTSTQTLSNGREELLKELESLRSMKVEHVELLRRLQELEGQQQDASQFVTRIRKLMGLIDGKNEKERRIKTLLETTLSAKTTLEEYKADVREAIRIIKE